MWRGFRDELNRTGKMPCFRSVWVVNFSSPGSLISSFLTCVLVERSSYFTFCVPVLVYMFMLVVNVQLLKPMHIGLSLESFVYLNDVFESNKA